MTPWNCIHFSFKYYKLSYKIKKLQHSSHVAIFKIIFKSCYSSTVILPVAQLTKDFALCTIVFLSPTSGYPNFDNFSFITCRGRVICLERSTVKKIANTNN